MAKTYWAIGQDYGSYEGQRAPLTLVEDEATTKAVCKLFNETYRGTDIYCVEVPVWPEVRECNSATTQERKV